MQIAKWTSRELEAAKALAGQGSQALRQNQLQVAEPALLEASVLLDMVAEDHEDVRKIRAQINNELGFVRQRQNNLAEAERLHREASVECDAIIESGVDFHGNAAATHINLASILAQRDDLKGAIESNKRAVELAEKAVESQPTTPTYNLAFGALQNLAAISVRAGEFDSANEAMTRAIAVLENLDEEGKKQASVQIAQAAQQVSVAFFNQKQMESARRWGLVAEEHSEVAYEVHGEPALNIYVTSQVNLISFHEVMKDFAEAENALFKALDVVGDHPQILERAKAFYEECRKLADPVLEAGNLPREEVDDSYQEILSRLERVAAKSPDATSEQA